MLIGVFHQWLQAEFWQLAAAKAFFLNIQLDLVIVTEIQQRNIASDQFQFPMQGDHGGVVESILHLLSQQLDHVSSHGRILADCLHPNHFQRVVQVVGTDLCF